MAAENICPNCGSANDPVFANCLFCNTPLIKVELSTLSTETIIENCGLWIGRLSGMQNYMGGAGIKIALENPPKGIFAEKEKIISHGDIQGNIDKYMTLLETRMIGNPELGRVLDRLNERYKDAKKSFSNEKKTENYYVIGAVIFIVFVFILIFFFGADLLKAVKK